MSHLLQRLARLAQPQEPVHTPALAHNNSDSLLFCKTTRNRSLGMTFDITMACMHKNSPEEGAAMENPATLIADSPTTLQKQSRSNRQTAHVVLVVEDEVFLRRLFSAALGQKGFQVMTAGNGQEALDHLAAHHVDLIMTDWNMPGMGGRELIATIKGQVGSDRPPIIVLSCEACPDRSRFDRTGFDAWLRKPCRISELQKIVLETIDIHVAGRLNS